MQYLDGNGNVLYEVNDSDKIFKMVNGKISGLAGTGNRMVIADSTGNLRAADTQDINLSGRYISSYVYQAGGNNYNIKMGSDIGSNGYLAGASLTESAYYTVSGNYKSEKTTSAAISLFDGNTVFYGNTGLTAGGTFIPTERMRVTPTGLKVASLAGTGNRTVYSDSTGVLTNTSSDERVKKNIKNITDEIDVLSALKNIRGVTYNWDTEKEGYEGAGEQQEIGVIAQEIEQYIPQVVGENSTGYKSVDYAKLTAYLIEVNKALLERVELLESKVV